MALLLMNTALMSLALFGLLLFRNESPWSLLPAILLVVVELGIVTAFALLYSSLTNPILAAVWTFATYVMGHLAWSLQLLKEKVPEGISRWLCDLVYWLLPNLERLNIKREVVHGLALPDGFVPWALLYGLAYSAVVLLLACVAFERKDFK
jgi:ABC-type transport system involved in multi-copper enzyme maturation permease subunit